MAENTKAKTTDGTHDKNIKNLFTNQVICLSVSWGGIPPNIPKIILFFSVFAGDSGQAFRDKYCSSFQLLWKFFLFELMSNIFLLAGLGSSSTYSNYFSRLKYIF